jgi:5-formyltetrahydrofolate cyclo-ligase
MCVQEVELKRALRLESISAREAIPEDDRAALCARIRERLASLPAWKQASLVALYAPLRGEVDLLPLVEMARAEGKRVVFPRASIVRRTLEFYEIESVDQLSPGAYGVPEPLADAKRRVPLAAVDLFLVPGVAFDGAGRRLGFGGGYYDRLLEFPGLATVGIAFEIQMRDALPEEAHDRKVDLVLTELRTMAPGRVEPPDERR